MEELEINSPEYNKKLLKEMPCVEGFKIPAGFPIPHGSDVYILREGQKEVVSEGGIIIPDNSTNMSYSGVVYSCGPLCSSGVRVGVKIVFDKNAHFAQILHKGKPYMLINECYIRTTLNESDFQYDPKSGRMMAREQRQSEQAEFFKTNVGEA